MIRNIYPCHGESKGAKPLSKNLFPLDGGGLLNQECLRGAIAPLLYLIPPPFVREGDKGDGLINL